MLRQDVVGNVAVVGDGNGFGGGGVIIESLGGPWPSNHAKPAVLGSRVHPDMCFL